MKPWARKSINARLFSALVLLSSGLASVASARVPFFRNTMAAAVPSMIKETGSLNARGSTDTVPAAATASVPTLESAYKTVMGTGAAGSHSCKSRLTHPAPRLISEGPNWRMEFVSQCELPTGKGTFLLRAYRYTKGDKVVEPVALYSGDLRGRQDVLLRVHDQCMTSEVLGSRRCDCREQLHMAIDKLRGEPGVIIYLPQEGRGIGLANKIAAYALQDQGLDTVQANEQLGFGEDERVYDYVPYILQDFGVESVRLLTNNPFKVRSLEALGVVVSDVVAHQGLANPHNIKYLKTKILKMEHTMSMPDLAAQGEEFEEEDAFDKPLPLGGHHGGSVSDSMTDSDRHSTTSSSSDAASLSDGEETALPASAEACAHPPTEGYAFGRETVVAALKAIGEGKLVVVVDDADRENEGDLIMAAEKATTESIAFFVRYSSGVICVAMEHDELERLKLPPMVVNNEDPKQTAFTVTVDYKHGTSTGISAADRALTLRKLADPHALATDFNRPGHIFPLRYSKGGVLSRRGHTEAAVDMSRLAGLRPAGVLCEICNDDGSMARLPQLEKFAKKHGLVLTSIQDLAAYRREEEGFAASSSK